MLADFKVAFRRKLLKAIFDELRTIGVPIGVIGNFLNILRHVHAKHVLSHNYYSQCEVQRFINRKWAAYSIGWRFFSFKELCKHIIIYLKKILYYYRGPQPFPASRPQSLPAWALWAAHTLFSWILLKTQQLLCSWDKSLNIGSCMLRIFLKVPSFTFDYLNSMQQMRSYSFYMLVIGQKSFIFLMMFWIIWLCVCYNQRAKGIKEKGLSWKVSWSTKIRNMRLPIFKLLSQLHSRVSNDKTDIYLIILKYLIILYILYILIYIIFIIKI